VSARSCPSLITACWASLAVAFLIAKNPAASSVAIGPSEEKKVQGAGGVVLQCGDISGLDDRTLDEWLEGKYDVGGGRNYSGRAIVL
jgi:hypothetical protein